MVTSTALMYVAVVPLDHPVVNSVLPTVCARIETIDGVEREMREPAGCHDWR